MAAGLGPRDLARPPAVLLVGGGSGRYDADVSRDASLRAFIRALSDTEVTTVGRDPRRLIERYAVPAVAPTALSRLLRSVTPSSALVFAGGTLLGARPRPSGKSSIAHLQGALALAAYAHAARATVLGVGLASADVRSGAARTLIREFARRTDLMVLRDDETAHDVVRAGVPAPVRVGADPVWTLVDEWPRPATTNSDVVFVVDDVDGRMAGGRVDVLGRLAAALAAHGLHIRVECWSRRASATTLATRLVRQVPAAEIADHPADLGQAAARLAGARLVVTARLHAQIAAAAVGVPSLSIEQESGQRALAARLGQPSAALPEASDPPAEAELAAAALAAVDFAPPSDAAIKDEVAAAHAGFDLLRLMLGVSDLPAARIDGLRLEAGVR